MEFPRWHSEVYEDGARKRSPVTGGTRRNTLVGDAGTVDLLTRVNLISRRLAYSHIVAGEVRGDIRQVLVAQVIQHAGHLRDAARTTFDIIQLLEQVAGVLARQFREVRRCTVTIGTVTSRANGSFLLARRCIARCMRNAGDAEAYQ